MDRSWNWTYRIGFVRNVVSVKLEDEQLKITEDRGSWPEGMPLASLRHVELEEHRSVFLMAVLAAMILAGFACMTVSMGSAVTILALCALWWYKSTYMLHHFGLNIVAVVDGQEKKFYLSEMGDENLKQIKDALDKYMASSDKNSKTGEG